MEQRAVKIQQLEEALNSAVRNLAPQLTAEKLVHVQELAEKDAIPYPVDIRISFDPCLAPKEGDFPIRPPDMLMLPSALYNALHKDNTHMEIAPGGPSNGFSGRLEELHAMAVNENTAFTMRLKGYYGTFIRAMHQDPSR